MLLQLRPRSYQNYLSLPILGSILDEFTKIAAGSPTPCGWGGKRRPASVSELDKSIPLVI